MVALCAEFLADERAMARRVLPVDRPMIETGHIGAQGIELRTTTLLVLNLDAEQSVGREEARRRCPHRTDVGYGRQRLREPIHVKLRHQAKGSAPTQPESLDRGLAATFRYQRKLEAYGLPRTDRSAPVRRRRQQFTDIALRLEPGAEAARRQSQVDGQYVRVADVQHGRPMKGPSEGPQGRRQYGVST